MLRCSVILLTTILLQVQQPGQQKSGQSAARLQRSEQVKKLASEIWIRTREDENRVTKDYAEDRLAQVRKIVQGEVLETLGRGKPEDVREAVAAIFQGTDIWGKRPGEPFVYSTNLQGLQTLVVGYSWIYGPTGIPWTKVIIQGYRTAGLTYEVAAETGEALGGCDLKLHQLDSPRVNEAWFLAHGHLIGHSRYKEMVRIYGFDGYQFKELWAPAGPMYFPAFKIAKDKVTVTRESELWEEGMLQDTILLRIGGPVVTTVRLQPQLQGRP